MIVADARFVDVGMAAMEVADGLIAAGAPALAHDLLVAIQEDADDGKVLKSLAVHDNRLFYGRRCLGEIP